jgi:hypothetical protein
MPARVARRVKHDRLLIAMGRASGYPPAENPRPPLARAMVKRKLKSSLVLAGVGLLSLVAVLSGCSVKPVVVPDGEWLDSTGVGVLWGRTRIYADKFWQQCSLSVCEYPYTDVILKIDSVKVPDSLKVYWYLLDPDDSADNATVDPNGSAPNDNVLRGRLLQCVHPFVDSINDTMVATQVDDDYQTSIRIAVPPKAQTPDSFYGGDDFKLKLKLGSVSSTDSAVTGRMWVWKLMRVELDCCEPESVEMTEEMVDSMYKLVRHPLTGGNYQSGEWDPDRCLYVESRREDIKDNFDDWVPYHMEVDTLDSLGNAFSKYVALYRDYDSSDYVYVHVAGDATWPDTSKWGRFPLGLATRGPGFSVVFAETAYAQLQRRDTVQPDPSHVIAGVYKVAMHEMGHQFMARRHCLDYDCIMDSSVRKFPDMDPHYCPACVLWARDSGRITLFRR